MKKSFRIVTAITLSLLVFTAAGCRKEQEAVTQVAKEENARYSVGLHIGMETERRGVVALEGREEKLSYALGLLIGRDIDRQELELVPDLVARGFQDGFSGEAALTDEEIEQVRDDFLEQRKTAQEDDSAKNLEEGKVFLAENAKREGVVTLPSGLQYRVLIPGEGAVPGENDNVKVHYIGRFIDGTEFENTYVKDQPAVFPVWGVIPGWTEALQLMQEGAKWELFVPSGLAYGEQGAGKIIGPNKTLIFEIELIGIH